jgi:hypothetical protein
MGILIRISIGGRIIMVTELRPQRGGFLRPFGCGMFIRAFLLGKGTEYGSATIAQDKGACCADVFYHYKLAMHKAYAEDATAWENDMRARAAKPLYSPEEYAERVDWHLRRIPYKLVKCRYHSFSRYFHWLKQLGWVEKTGEEERSTIQGYLEESEITFEAPPRVYYRLTDKGKKAPDWEWSRPQLVLYPEIAGENAVDYFKRKRAERKYVKKSPTKSRRTIER